MRQKMFERVALPPDLLQKALRKLDMKLEAKETKFFSFQGQVVEKVEVEAHGAQLEAADKILKIANVYGRESDTKQVTPGVALEVDPRTGILRLVIGGANAPDEESRLPQDNAIGTDTSSPLEASPEQLSLPAFEPNGHLISGEDNHEAEPQVIKVKRGKLPVEVFNALYGITDG